MTGRIIHLLIQGPGTLRSPAAYLAVSVLALAGAALLTWSGVLHLMVWSDGYKDIATIGPLFLAQGVGSIVLALAVAVLRWLALLAAGAVTLAATAAGLLVSVHVGLFGLRESLATPYATLSLQVEFTGAGVLLAAAVLLLVAPSAGTPSAGADRARRARRGRGGKPRKSGEPGNPSHARFRT
jgi:hypothetical protein